MKSAGFALLLAAGAAQAQAPAAVDETKPVTRAEVSAKLDADYADLDGDKDGKVTPAEISARLVRSGEAELANIRKRRDEAFAKLDADGNGSITKAEFDAKTQMPKLKDPDPKPVMDQFDTNKDGAIAREEFRALTLANFERLDANKDGTVTPAEAKTGAAAPTPRKTGVKETPPVGR